MFLTLNIHLTDSHCKYIRVCVYVRGHMDVGQWTLGRNTKTMDIIIINRGAIVAVRNTITGGN